MSEELVGGTYTVDKDGKRTLVEKPTKNHPEGNLGARDSDGKLVTAREPEPESAAPKAPKAKGKE